MEFPFRANAWPDTRDLDRMLLKAPILGPLQRKAAIARFRRTLVSSGVSILDGLEITACIAGNRSRGRIGPDVVRAPILRCGPAPLVAAPLRLAAREPDRAQLRDQVS